MRILLADDRAETRSALRLLLEHQPGLQIVGEAADEWGLAAALRADCPDLVLLDWELPGFADEHSLVDLRRLCPRLIVIALSSRPEARQAALAAGADAFVSKGDPPEQLLGALRTVGADP